MYQILNQPGGIYMFCMVHIWLHHGLYVAYT